MKKKAVIVSSAVADVVRQVELLFKIGRNDWGPPLELLSEPWPPELVSTPSEDMESAEFVGALSVTCIYC